MNFTELQRFKPQILVLAERCGIKNIRVFGSVARGDATDGSDVDLLVSAPANIGWGFFGFALDVEDLIQCKVDLVSDRAINPHIRDLVLREAKPL